MPDDSGRPDLTELAEERAHERFEHEHPGEGEPPPIVPIRGLHYQDENGMHYLGGGLTDAPDGTVLVKKTISGEPALVFEDTTEVGSIPTSQKGKPGGVGTLDGEGHQSAAEISPLVAQGFNPTAVKTGAYTALPGDYVPVSISGGSVAITLPSAPPDRSRIGVKIVATSGTPGSTTLTINRGGADVFNVAGGSTSLALSAKFQGIVLQYKASTGIWYVQTTDTPLNEALGGALLGTDNTVGGPGGSPLSASVVSSSQTGGVAKLPAGLRNVVNITDPKYGCVADNGVTNNFAGMELAKADAEALHIPMYAPGAALAYGVTGFFTAPAAGLLGDGHAFSHFATRFLLGSATSCIAFGHTGVGEGPSHGNNPKPEGLIETRCAMSGNFLVNANKVATQPLLIGDCVQTKFLPITVLNGAAQPAYNAGTTYKPGQRVFFKGFTFVNLVESTGTAPSVTEWVANKGAGAYPLTTATWQVVADSIGVVLQHGQNNLIEQLCIQECEGTGLATDGGWGGGSIKVLEVNGCGSAGAAQVMHFQTYATPEAYLIPSNFTIKDAIIERAAKGCTAGILHVAGRGIKYRDPVIEAQSVGNPYSGVAMVYDGTHTSYDLSLRDAVIALDSENTNCFSVANNCKLRHTETQTGPGQTPQYCYLLQEGARIEEERPFWPEAGITLLNPSGTITTLANFQIAVVARHYAPVKTYAVGSSTAQAEITPSGLVYGINFQVGSGSSTGGGSGCVGYANTGTPPTSGGASVVTYGHGNAVYYRTAAGTIGIAGGNWQTKEASYKAVAGDVGVLMTVPASAALNVELPEAATYGRGIFTVRRTDNNAGATLEVKRQGADTLGKAGEALGTAAIAVAAFQVQRFVSDGTSKWYGL